MSINEFFTAGFAALILSPAVAQANDLVRLDRELDAIRVRYDLPALAAAVVRDDGVFAVGVSGFRKYGDPIPVTLDDQFHLGSCSKAITATLIGRLIEIGKLDAQMTVGRGLPQLAKTLHPAYRDVTLNHLLAHRAGLPPPELSWQAGKSALDIHQLPGSARQQRWSYIEMMLAQPPVAEPGTKQIYSNVGPVVAAVMAEQAMDKPWESLMREMIFEPLKMETAGFGAMGEPKKIEQPWQHQWMGSRRVPVEPGPLSDNPLVLGPAGTVHCSIGDWGRFVAAHLAGARGKDSLLRAATFQDLHSPPFDDNAALGWFAAERDWGGGSVWTHAGSNGSNYAVVWLAPRRNFAVLVTTNEGGDHAASACDETAGKLIQQFLSHR